MKPIPGVFTIAAVVLAGASLALAWQPGERRPACLANVRYGSPEAYASIIAVSP